MASYSQNYYCTLFNSTYLSRGLAMLESLHIHDERALVAAFCFDDATYSVLKSLGWQWVLPIKLAELETAELLSVKASRTLAEYCWTSTPCTIAYCFEKLQFPHCTYVDADVYFFSSPIPVLKETESGSVLLTDHFYTPAYDQSQTSGRYCVQFMYFRNNEEGRTALYWWKEACLAWCFNREEDGKFGDQKYLDDWPTRFKGIVVSNHRGAGVAPWNVQQYQMKLTDERPHFKFGESSWPVIFYHFHGLKLILPCHADLSAYPIPAKVKEALYRPYLDKLSGWEARIGKEFNIRADRGAKLSLRQKVKRLIKGTHNVTKVKE